MGRAGSCPGTGLKLLRNPGQDLGVLCPQPLGGCLALGGWNGLSTPQMLGTGNGRNPSSRKPGCVPSSGQLQVSNIPRSLPRWSLHLCLEPFSRPCNLPLLAAMKDEIWNNPGNLVSLGKLSYQFLICGHCHIPWLPGALCRVHLAGIGVGRDAGGFANA